VVEAVIGHLRRESQIGGYEAAAEASTRIESTYDSVAALLGCGPGEVAIVENATRAWDMAFYSIPFRAGDRILTARTEYASNYIAFLQMARRVGVEIVPIPNDSSGQLDVEALRRAMDDRVKLIAVSHVPTNGGLVNPAVEIGRVAREGGVLYLLDACQSVGQMPVRVDEIGCDFLSATSRKYLRGPRGMGLLYVRRAVLEDLEPPFLDLHAAEWTAPGKYVTRPDARRFETWETNWAGKIGLGVAVEYARSWGLDAIWNRVSALATRVRVALEEVPGVTLADVGRVQCGLVTFTAERRSAGEIKSRLGERGINVAVSPRNFTRLDMEDRGLEEVVRASVHYYNSEEEIDRFIESLREVV
jgi:selenocysteine lyase/cysteine desulfurase